MISELSNSDLLSKVTSLLELNSASSILRYELDVYADKSKLAAYLESLLEYRNELISRISNTDTVLERSTLSQAYYKLIGNIRYLDSYLKYKDDKKLSYNMELNLTSKLKTSAALIDNLVISNYQYTQIDE
jgi:hypothetical protein